MTRGLSSQVGAPKPLEGVRVVDLSQVVSGPYATMILAEQGADVVKVEPLGGDYIRDIAIRRGGMSSLYLNLNRGKRSIAVDLQSDAGREVVLDLIAEADVVVQNFRPGVVDRLGIGYDAARSRNAGVVYVSISGYGPDGPLADLPVYDPIIQALVGVVARQQSEAIPLPDFVRNVMIDKATALTAAQAICAAWVRRARTGQGDHLIIPMLDVGVYFFWPDGMADFTFVGDGAEPGPRVPDTYEITQCADGQLVHFPATPAHLCGLYRAINRPEMADDERYNGANGRISLEHWAHIDGVVNQALGEMTVASAIQALHREGVPAAPVNQPDQVIDHPQVVHNQSLHTWDHPTSGVLRQPRHPVTFASSATPVPEFVDGIGEHTDEILRQLGRSVTQIDDLRSAGIVA